MKPLWIHGLGLGEIIVLLIGYACLLLKLLPLFLAVSALIGTLGYIYFMLNEFNSQWEKKGIQGPKGNILFGTLFEIFKGLHKFDKEYSDKYGKSFGTTTKGTLDFITSDLDLIKDVLIKNFDAFPDRFNPFAPSDDVSRAFLTMQQGDDWRRIRHKITPAFTSGKVKKLLPAVHRCSQELIKYLDTFAANGEDVPLKDVFSKVTLNVIGTAAFAFQLNLFDDKEASPFLERAQSLFNVKMSDPRLIFVLLFPNLSRLYTLCFGKNIFRGANTKYFTDNLSLMMEQRENDPDAKNKYNDMFQLLMNSMDDKEKQQVASEEDKDIISENVSKVDSSKKLTRVEVLAQLVLFLLAGYETTATTLHFACYNLAYKQDVQDRLRAEIMEVLDGKDTIDYDDMPKLVYLNQVIAETLRQYPPAIRINRLCQKDITINNVEFEEGMCFSINVYNIHHDPENYENPDEFDPDRFTPENKESRHPMAYLPWGAGPRICLGMRFAEYELRVVLVDLIKNYKLTPAEGMPGLPVEIDAAGLIKPVVTLKCKIEKI